MSELKKLLDACRLDKIHMEFDTETKNAVFYILDEMDDQRQIYEIPEWLEGMDAAAYFKVIRKYARRMFIRGIPEVDGEIGL